MLRRLGRGALRWVGAGPPPAVGISYDDRFVVVAVVDPAARRVRGVAVGELEPRTVIAGVIERPDELTAALGVTLASLRLSSPAAAGVCVPVGVDHRGQSWPPLAASPDRRSPSEVIGEAAGPLRLDVRVVAPAALVGARLGALVVEGAAGATRRPISVVVQSGWLCSVVDTADRHVSCRTERSESFRTPPDVRWGLSSDRSGAEVDPFHWPKAVRPHRKMALLAAGAAMLT